LRFRIKSGMTYVKVLWIPKRVRDDVEYYITQI